MNQFFLLVMVYEIKPHSDDIIYVNNLDDEIDYTGETENYLPVNSNDEYLVSFEKGLKIKASLTINGWDLEVLKNPFNEDDILKDKKDRNEKDDLLLVDVNVDLGEIKIE